MASSVRRPEEGFLESSARLNGLQVLRKSVRLAKKHSMENIKKATQVVKMSMSSRTPKTGGLQKDLIEREEELQKREQALLQREAALMLREQQLQQKLVEVGAKQQKEQEVDQLIEEELGECVFEV
jgi:hypothetical protein